MTRVKRAIFADTLDGFDDKANLTLRKPCGSRTHRITKIALNHAFGGPPEIRFTDRFCLGGSNRDLPEIYVISHRAQDAVRGGRVAFDAVIGIGTRDRPNCASHHAAVLSIRRFRFKLFPTVR